MTLASLIMAQFVELRPDRSLLNPDFDRYVLSSRKPDLRRVAIKAARPFTLSNEQYGYQHGLLTSTVDRLVIDPFVSSEDQLYYFSQDGKLVKLIYKPKLGNCTFAQDIADVDYSSASNKSYPPSLHFPDKDFGVISSGTGSLYVYKTGDRSQNLSWNLVFGLKIDNTYENLPGDSDVESPIPFVVVDVRSKDQNQLAILVQSVEKEKESEKSNFYSRLVWLDVDLNKGQVIRRREIQYHGNLQLASLNYNATELLTVGSGQVQFRADTEKDVHSDIQEVEMTDPQKPVYVWTQTAEEIVVTFSLGETINKKDVEYRLNSGGISVKVKGHILLEGQLEGSVHADSSVWTVGPESLELTLFKARGHFWRELVPTDTRGLYEPNSDEIKKAVDSLEKFTTSNQELPSGDAQQSTFNPEQLEECDATGDLPTFIHWTDGDSHKLIQSADISSSQIIFQTRLQPGGPRTLCTRNEHDGIVWSLDEVDLSNDSRIAHKFTLNAFGYVQASHSNKIGSNCSPDGGFAYVCHSDHHIFVYLQSMPITSDCVIKNRKSGKSATTFSEQLVLNTATALDPSDNPLILGMTHSNQMVYLITANAVIAANVKGN